MAIKHIPKQRDKYNELNKRLNSYSMLVQSLYDSIARSISPAVLNSGYDGSVPFSLRDYPEVCRAMDDAQVAFAQEMKAVIMRGTSAEWKESNMVQDMLADGILKYYGTTIGVEKTKVYYEPNNDALKAFQERKQKGLNLSQNIWNQSVDMRNEMECCLSTSIEKGISAVKLSKKLSKYLSDFESIKKDYKDKYGKAVSCKDCEYRSIRLARSEINMAYRTAEQKRWEQMDFVVGYEIKTTKNPNHVSDICDELAGKYPKDFDWKGWHPNCRCYKIPILQSEEEFFEDKEPEFIKLYPKQFNDYIDKNCNRVYDAEVRDTLPYWVKDNQNIKDCSILMAKARQVGDSIQVKAEHIAEECNGVVTPINYKGFGSMYRKLTNPEDICTIDDIKDSVRNTIIVNRGEIENVLYRLQQMEEFSRLKRQTADKFCGYSGNIINLNMPNGIKAEIQVNTPMMIYAKESESVAKSILGEDVWNKIYKMTNLQGGLGHKFYEEIRVLNSVKDADKIRKLTKLSEEYYSHFTGDIE